MTSFRVNPSWPDDAAPTPQSRIYTSFPFALQVGWSMPTDDVVWAGIVLTGIVILVSYYVVVWARGVRKQLQRLNEASDIMHSRWLELENDVGALMRQMAVKVTANDVERYVAVFSVPVRRTKSRSKMVMKRG